MNNDTLEACNCPCCDSDNIRIADSKDAPRFVRCLDCNLTIYKGKKYNSIEDVLAAWNTRSSIPKERLLEYIEERKQEYLGYNDITVLIDVDDLIEFIGSMEGKDTTVTDYITQQARMANK